MNTARQIEWVERKFANGWEDIEPDVVVWVDVVKLDSSWIKDQNYIGLKGAGKSIGERYKKVGQWIKSGRAIDMALVTISSYSGEVSFVDGRHRFAWLRDHGVKAIPVQSAPGCTLELEQRFGTAIRISELTGL